LTVRADAGSQAAAAEVIRRGRRLLDIKRLVSEQLDWTPARSED
jgi:hypothetical protein